MASDRSLVSRRQPGGVETQLTFGPYHHWLMPFGPFSPDGRWIIYDIRAEEGGMGRNPAIEKVDAATGEIFRVYETPGQNEFGPGCGTVSFGPDGSALFIHGPLGPAAGKAYEQTRRVAALVRAGQPGATFLDARDLTPPFTPGALRGGTHAHEWSADGHWIGFTYNDQVMADLGRRQGRDLDLRTIGVMTDLRPVSVDRDPAGENSDGAWFAVVVARVTPEPRPGSDEISRAFENAWVGRRGYRRPDGSWQRAQAFLGRVRAADGREINEVFIAEIPDRIDLPGPTGPLPGTETTFPQPPAGVVVRRLTRTEGWTHPGAVTEPRHWVACHPDGRWIAFLGRDPAGLVHIFLVSPAGGDPLQLTANPFPVQGTIAWRPDGSGLAYPADGSLWLAEVDDSGRLGQNLRLTDRAPQPPYYPSWSPDGARLGYVRELPLPAGSFRQVFVLQLSH